MTHRYLLIVFSKEFAFQSVSGFEKSFIKNFNSTLVSVLKSVVKRLFLKSFRKCQCEKLFWFFREQVPMSCLPTIRN